jgi:hypothetical protein
VSKKRKIFAKEEKRGEKLSLLFFGSLKVIPHADQSIAEFLATAELRADVTDDVQAFGKLDG